MFDYFIVSHPISIFYMTAHIIVNEIRLHKMKDTEDFILHFQNYNFDSVDAEDLIAKTEESLKLHPVSEFIPLMHKLKIHKK